MIPTRSIVALALLAGVFVMEGYDLFAMSLALPKLDAGLPAVSASAGPIVGAFAWVLGLFGAWPPSYGMVFAALLIGLGVGGALIAPYGDRFGRRTLIVLGCLATGALTIATTRSESIAEFLVWRALTGVALGAALPNVSALSAELAPARLRATIMALVSAGIPVGIGLSGLFAPEVVSLWDWPGLFYVPAGFALVLGVVLFFVLDGGLPQRLGEQPAEAQAKPAGKLPQLALFRMPWLVPFAIVAAMLSLNAMNLYLLNSWLPSVLPQAGFEQDLSARISGIVQFAGIGIGVAASIGIDRWRPATTLVLMFGAIAACFLAVSLTAPDALRWTLLLSVGVGGASAGGMALPALCAHLFPAHLLSSAIGLGVMVARLGAFAGPIVGEAIIKAEVGAQAYFFAAAIPAALCMLVAFTVPLALRAKQREEAKA